MSQSVLSNAPVVYALDSFSLRVLVRDGEPWFYAGDACKALGISNVSQACSRLDADEMGITLNDTPSGQQQLLIVNEAGLYQLVLSSRKAVAKEFKRWITHEVLPQIRKTGRYARPDMKARDDDFIRQCFAMTLAASTPLLHSLFDALVKAGKLELPGVLRLMTGFDTNGMPMVKPMPDDAFVVSVAGLPERIHELQDKHLSNADLARIAEACTARLAARFPEQPAKP